jgi:hypothetical protein
MMSRDKPGTSDATDADINKCEVLCRQSRPIIYNVYTFLKKSDDERAETDLSKTWKLTVQTCGTSNVHTVLRICSEAKILVQQKVLPIFMSPGKKHNIQKRVTNLDDFEKDVLRGEFPMAKKLSLELKDWFVNRFLNYLEEGSIIIMDHSIIVDKVPNTGFHKKKRYSRMVAKEVC